MPGRRLHILCAVVMLIASQLVSSGQAKIYTKKAKLKDFTIKTMKVVVDGDSPLAVDFRDEISRRWRLSPFEFCSASIYDSLTEDNTYYFLRLVSDEGIAFLLLEKGGKKNEDDRLRKPFEVVRIPVGSAGATYSFGIANIDVYLDILQMYVGEAMASDKFGYGGLEVYNTSGMKGKTVLLGADSLDELSKGTSDTVVPLVFTPEPEGSWCYKMLVDAGSHELFYFNRTKYRKASDAEFSTLELKSFKLRNAVVIE